MLDGGPRDGPPYPPDARGSPAEPWRPSMTRVALLVWLHLGGLDALGGDELGLALADRLRQLVAEGVADLLLVANLGEHLRMAPLEVAVEEFLEGPHGIDRHVVEQSLAPGEDDRHLLLDRQRLVLTLLEELDHALAAGQLRLGRAVEIGAELREGCELPILGQVESELARHLAHGLDLRRSTHARDREADVHGRPDATIEQFGLPG